MSINALLLLFSSHSNGVEKRPAIFFSVRSAFQMLEVARISSEFSAFLFIYSGC